MIMVEDVHLDYLTNDKTGQVTGGWLRLKGRLLETNLVRVSAANRTVRNHCDVRLDDYACVKGEKRVG